MCVVRHVFLPLLRIIMSGLLIQLMAIHAHTSASSSFSSSSPPPPPHPPLLFLLLPLLLPPHSRTVHLDIIKVFTPTDGESHRKNQQDATV